MPKQNDKEALDYHQFPKPGKISVESLKPLNTQKDLSLAYTPGVAVPCLEIEKNPENVYKYTSKGNLVGVISNGTAVLGLGNIGALASKPVMEGKGVLFKKFSAIDCFDIEVDTLSIDRFCSVVMAIAPTFGGINLEDIKAPECFEIERRLIEELTIPVMHDDQHGTAVISSAAIINGCELAEKKLENLKIVIVGAGAAAIGCAKMYKHLGIKKIVMIDSKGVLHNGRSDLNEYKREFAQPSYISHSEAFFGADVVVGLSMPGTFSVEDIMKMEKNPIIFALANPTPEIFPDVIKAARPDAIVATGRSDFDNQVNNVLGFPFIFRGALDVHAKKINIEMKVAAAKALALLAKEKVPAYIEEIYGKKFKYSKEYLIPKPFDKRLIVEVSSAVAEAAVKSGVSPHKRFDRATYKKELASLIED
ncbi:MAG: malic enzyme-like NAD(P)-binding protein [Sulfurimonadaceae bacterium]|jgi:malate dehydrogenase (oxaloacetate-decarboxylating)/malate dehydrogenase (oxaloacetate-decarboxylating)(NADP+)|nr:malic enzyme-like NAD(P)-binding protein [Sulfurimonadaceae bacterium]